MPASTAISIRSRSTGCARSSRACWPPYAPITRIFWSRSALRAISTTPLAPSSRARSRPTPGRSPDMASLKDLRNRIASTKATQKITKAMQMVAASKLRRAQAAAMAARPFAEHMETVLRNIAAAVTDLSAAPKLLAGTGREEVYLLVVCTAERGLCGAFNSAIVRLARERATALSNQGKQVKFLCVGRKGYDQLRRMYEKQIVDLVELRVRALRFEHAQKIAD